MYPKSVAALAAIAALLVAWVIGCVASDSDDGDESSGDDDDNDNDDDQTPADDDDDNDDNDTGPYTCGEVANQLENVCGFQFNLIDDDDDQSYEEWCELSEGLFSGKIESPFWNCMGLCGFVEDCEEACFDACIDRPDPGGNGCDHTVHGIYACSVVFIFDVNLPYWIPEMDLMAACTGSMSGEPWDCYGQCVATLTCSDPPTSQEANAMIGCLDACP
jgi:hypothetical protein